MFFSCSNDLSSFNRVCFEGFSSGFTTFSMTFWPACWVFSMNSYTISEFLSKAWELAWHKKCFAATIVLFLPRSVGDSSNFAFDNLFWFKIGCNALSYPLKQILIYNKSSWSSRHTNDRDKWWALSAYELAGQLF